MEVEMRKLKTSRTLIRPLSDNELSAMIAEQKDEHLKNAYTEMLEGCKNHPKDRRWYCCYLITDNKTGAAIGDICFKGAPKEGAVEIGIGINPEFTGKGYGTETMKYMINWAFNHGAYIVYALVENDNPTSMKMMDKLNMRPYGKMDDCLLFAAIKPISYYIICFVIAATVISALVSLKWGQLETMSIAILIGLFSGIVLGGIFDAVINKKLKTYSEVWNKSHGQANNNASDDSGTN